MKGVTRFLLVLSLVTLFFPVHGHAKTILLEKSFKALNLIGGGSFIEAEKSPIYLPQGASKIVVDFSNVKHSYAIVKIYSNPAGTEYYFYDSKTKFSAFTKTISLEKSEGQPGYYYLNQIGGKRDLINHVGISIYISTAKGCPWLNFYRGKVEVYAE